MVVIMGKKTVYCGNQQNLFTAKQYINKFIEESKENPNFIKTLDLKEKMLYRNDFELIDNIYGLSDEEQQFYEKLK